jgi:hypothetical protein
MDENELSGERTTDQGPRSAPKYLPRVIVKFSDEVGVEDEGAIGERLAQFGIKAAFAGQELRFRHLYSALKPAELQRLVALAEERDPTYRAPNFLSYFVVDCPSGVHPLELAKEISAWPLVEEAYPDQRAEDPVVNAADDPRSGNQGYLDPSPDGVDARAVWPLPGGDGAGQRIIDLEQGWTLNHEDLTAHGATVLFGSVVNSSRYHGTAVLGEICAVDNALGDVGIAPNVASVNVVSHSGATSNIPNAIATAIANLDYGHLLLLEVQINFLPAETVPANFAAIRLATALGVVVVEAAGNGANDLDLYTDSGGLAVLNRGSADFKDSYAIMVGAANSPSPHSRWASSNFGSRIDCYGWGQNVDSTSSDSAGSTTLYTSVFQGTSSASPIVTGAALCVQGLAEASLGLRFGPVQLRAILSNAATGTASANPATDRIGVMPDLAAIAGVLSLRPDVWLRDYIGDSGDPHTGPISASPDVILRKTAVTNPQASFGQGSGTENDDTLGFEAEAGQPNYIYVRVMNRGPVAATNVTATVYWSPVATLVTPATWSLVGSVTIANVPNGNVLTVSAGITWPAASVPGTGHYCLVAIIGNADDPAPLATDFTDWTNYNRFIRENNNVTWRNFNVVDNDPSATGDPSGMVPLAFLLTGAPDKGRVFELRVVARLPEGAKLLLELPTAAADLIGLRSPFAERRGEGEVVTIPLNPFGQAEVGRAFLPAKFAAPCRLLVHIPTQSRKHPFTVHVSQFEDELEVGRVGWRLVPKRRLKLPPGPKVRLRPRAAG